ncbi:MAG: hypothetical protein ACFFB5_19535 [Promethearchaeota archaeon]
MRFGMAIFIEETDNIEEFSKIEGALAYLEEEKKILVDNTSGVYSLSEKGEVEAQKYAKGLYSFLLF